MLIQRFSKIYVVFLGLAFLVTLPLAPLHISSIVNSISFVILLIGIYKYTWGTEDTSVLLFWKAFFALAVLSHFYYNYFATPIHLETFISTTILLPAFVMLYRHAYKHHTA